MKTEELSRRTRRHIVEMANKSKHGHTVCALSIVDILAVLYNDVLNISTTSPKNDNRDRFILSEGHAGAAHTAVLAELGFFSIEDLYGKFVDGGILTNSLYPKSIPGFEVETGSLGLGFPLACGMAYAAKKDNKRHNIYCVVGDGECQEGSIWEAALFAGHHKLSNLTVVVNCNKIQCQERTENILSLTNIAEMWKSFGWYVIEIDGHNLEAIRNAIIFRNDTKPTCIIAHTIKGKGVSFMEDDIVWHAIVPESDNYLAAVAELEAVQL